MILYTPWTFSCCRHYGDYILLYIVKLYNKYSESIYIVKLYIVILYIHVVKYLLLNIKSWNFFIGQYACTTEDYANLISLKHTADKQATG